MAKKKYRDPFDAILNSLIQPREDTTYKAELARNAGKARLQEIATDSVVKLATAKTKLRAELTQANADPQDIKDIFKQMDDLLKQLSS